jgi:hypothetical protein
LDPQFHAQYFEELARGGIAVEGRSVPLIHVEPTRRGFTVFCVWEWRTRWGEKEAGELHVGDFKDARKAIVRAFEVAGMTRNQLEDEFGGY